MQKIEQNITPNNKIKKATLLICNAAFFSYKEASLLRKGKVYKKLVVLICVLLSLQPYTIISL